MLLKVGLPIAGYLFPISREGYSTVLAFGNYHVPSTSALYAVSSSPSGLLCTYVPNMQVPEAQRACSIWKPYALCGVMKRL
jgi:hypothetical protein